MPLPTIRIGYRLAKAGKRYLPKNFMLSALTVSPICGNAMILLPNCESAQTPHVFNNPYKENSP